MLHFPKKEVESPRRMHACHQSITRNADDVFDTLKVDEAIIVDVLSRKRLQKPLRWRRHSQLRETLKDVSSLPSNDGLFAEHVEHSRNTVILNLFGNNVTALGNQERVHTIPRRVGGLPKHYLPRDRVCRPHLLQLLLGVLTQRVHGVTHGADRQPVQLLPHQRNGS